jgi:thioredoxin-dependent peroxiredoxin
MLKEGDKAPAFSLLSDEGEKVSLKELKGKTIILYFYPKALTSGCTVQACDFRDSASALKKHKAVVLGVSRDPVKLLVKFKEKHELNFPLLSDEDGETCEKYGVWKEKSMYGKKYMGIERTTFVIGSDGKIEKIFPKVKVKDHARTILDAIS